MRPIKKFLPAGAPLLDHLVHDTRKLKGWKYPKLKDLEKYQSNRGLSLGMLEEIEVRELVCGVSSEKEIAATREWINKMHEKDQGSFGSQVVSLDVEDVKVTYTTPSGKPCDQISPGQGDHSWMAEGWLETSPWKDNVRQWHNLDMPDLPGPQVVGEGRLSTGADDSAEGDLRITT